MNQRHLLVILLIGLLGAGTFFLFQKPQFVSQEVTDDEKLVFPGLADEDIETIVISSRFDTLTLQKKGSDWAITEKDDYLADPLIITQVLSTLAKLKITQKSTVNESHWGQLGVLAPQAGEGSGYQVTLSATSGYQKGIIIGRLQGSGSEASSMFGEDFDGRNFIRLQDSNQVCLVDKSLSFFNTISSNWLMNILSIPHGHKSITYVEQGENLWKIARDHSREEPYRLHGNLGDKIQSLPNLSITVDYAFASMIIKDVFPENIAPATTGLSDQHYFELEGFDGFTQRIYLGAKTKISEEEKATTKGTTGVMRQVRAAGYRYARLDWQGDRQSPPAQEPPYAGLTYLIHGPKMEDFMINRDELLVFEKMSPTDNQ